MEPQLVIIIQIEHGSKEVSKKAGRKKERRETQQELPTKQVGKTDGSKPVAYI